MSDASPSLLPPEFGPHPWPLAGARPGRDPRGAAVAAVAATVDDPVGFQVGWDHAHHGLVPPPGLLLDGTPVGQGWRAGRAVFGSRTLTATRWVRSWLELRTQAWRQQAAFDDRQVTPAHLSQIHVERCPVLRTPLGGAPDGPEAAVIDRVDPQAGYAAGNLATLSRRAAQSRAGIGVQQALRLARRAQADSAPVDGLDAAQWLRLAALRSFATALPFAEAARVPLALLPPSRVRPLHPLQRLQSLLTLQFAGAGWAARTRAIAGLLPAGTALRHDYNWFIGALAARVLEAAGADSGRPPRREALEDAWLHDRVQRRWEQFALALGAEAAARLADQAASSAKAG